MEKLAKKFENIMTAIAFAEAGELETAREIVTETRDHLYGLTGKHSDMNMLVRCAGSSRS